MIKKLLFILAIGVGVGIAASAGAKDDDEAIDQFMGGAFVGGVGAVGILLVSRRFRRRKA